MCAVNGISKQKKPCVCQTSVTAAHAQFLRLFANGVPVHGCCNISSMEYQIFLRSICVQLDRRYTHGSLMSYPYTIKMILIDD